MEISTLKGQIKTNSLQPLYIFYGPEIEIMKIYLDQIKKTTGYDITSLDNITEIVNKTNNNSLIKTAQICVLRDCKEFISDDKSNAVIQRILAQKQHIFILIYNTLDKRTKFYKTYVQDYGVEFEHLKPEVLTKYISKEIQLSEQNKNVLMEICENDYSRIFLEIDKMKAYSKYSGVGDFDVIFNQFLEDGTIYQPPYDAVFDFVDAVLKNRYKWAFELLQSSFDYGEATLVLLANLYNSTKQLLQVQSYEGNNLANATGLNSFQIKLAQSRVNYNSDSRLIELLRLIRRVERAFKVGEIEESLVMPYILVEFWS